MRRKLCQYYMEDYGLSTRVVRFPQRLWPAGYLRWAAVKRRRRRCAARFASAPNPGKIEVWGDGKQTRSFMYVDDCVEGIHRIMRSDYRKPLNLGTDELVTVDELAKNRDRGVGEEDQARARSLQAAGSARSENSDNTRLRAVLQWEPQMTLRKGIAPTYHWIAAHMAAAASVEKGMPGAAVAAE